MVVVEEVGMLVDVERNSGCGDENIGGGGGGDGGGVGNASGCGNRKSGCGDGDIDGGGGGSGDGGGNASGGWGNDGLDGNVRMLEQE